MKLTVQIFALVLLTAAMWYQSALPEVIYPEVAPVKWGTIEGFEVNDIGPSENEKSGLPRDTVISKSRYSDGAGQVFVATAVLSGRERCSIHRPELCLPTQGFLMSDPHTVSVDGVDWRFIVLEKEGCRSFLAYTFYNTSGFRTCSHIRRIFSDIWDRSVHGRINRWTMITVHGPEQSETDLTAFLKKLEGARR